MVRVDDDGNNVDAVGVTYDVVTIAENSKTVNGRVKVGQSARQDIRLIVLAGFEWIELTGDVFDRPEDFKLGAWIQKPFGIGQENVYNIACRLTPEAATVAHCYLFDPTQHMTEWPCGSLTVSFGAGGLREM